MILAVLDIFNDCNFGIKLEDESQVNKAKELAIEGLAAWYMAAHTEIEPTEHFTKEDIESMFDMGYAEPASELLDRFGIKHEIVELEYENDTLICDDYVCY